MPRKELLIAGFRNLARVAKGLSQRKAAQAAQAYGNSKLNVGAALPAKAGGAAPTTKPQLKQPAAAQRGGRDGVAGAPSFAAAAATAPAAGGSLSGLGFKAAAAAASALRQRLQGSPSFAAASVWGKPAAPAAPHAPTTDKATPGAARPQVPSAVASNPLYRWAKLGESSSAAAQAAKPASEQQELAAGLGRYARQAVSKPSAGAAAPQPVGEHDLAAGLGRYARQAASKPASGAASAATKPGSMAALLHLAKLAK